MKHTQLIFLLILIIILQSCTIEEDLLPDVSAYDCENTTINTHPDSSKFQAFIDEKVQEGLPGITLLLENKKGIWSGSAGVTDIKQNIPMKPCNLHKIGSVTKMFTASLIFQLYESEKLEFSDLISDYLADDIVSRLPNGKSATIQHLLNHSSGIPDFLNIAYTIKYLDDPYNFSSAEADISFILDEDPLYPAGTLVSYSNTNYLLLGMIAHSITGMDGDILFQQEIFEPLGMTKSSFNLDGRKPEGLSRGYYDESGAGEFIDITDFTFVSHSMAGGAVSTTDDLYRFITSSFTPGVLYNMETIEKMISIPGIPYKDKDDFTYGEEFNVNSVEGIALGWFLLDTDRGVAYGHNGGYNGRRARMWYFPESKSTIVFLYNASGESLEKLEKELFRNEMIEILFE